jgi:aryl-alcohol dehydrogenase-like predicted oxidoreductase
MEITTIGLGTWAIGGGGWAFAWGPQDDQESIAALQRGLELGINWIDTAPVYGLGHAEEVVGRVLKQVSPRPYIFTKCTRLWDEQGQIYGSLKAHTIRQEVEQSLQRLGVDVIDLYQVHWPDPDDDLEECWSTMSALKAEGKVRFIGVSNFSVEQMRRVQHIAPIDSLQPPYSMLFRDIEAEHLGFCAEHHIGVLCYSPMAFGLLAGAMTRERIATLPDDDWRRNHPEFQEPRLSRNLELVEVLRTIGQRHGRTPGEVAIAWTLRQSAVSGAIVGVRRPDQVNGIIGAGALTLSSAELAEIESFLPTQPAAGL